jgi:hypothetical protein
VLADSQVVGLAFSVQGASILDALPELISQLGLSHNIAISGGEVSVKRVNNGADFVLPLAQAAYIIYLFHFICRMHPLVLDVLKGSSRGVHDYCDWQISPDNFPFGSKGDMSKLFSLCANSASALRLVSGRLFMHLHLGGDPGVDVCDNLAGMLRQDLGTQSSQLPLSAKPMMGSMYWEIHSLGQAH